MSLTLVNISVLLPPWMCVSVPLLEYVSALTIADGCIKHISALTSVDGCFVSLVEYISALTSVDGCFVSLVEYISALTTVDGCVCGSGATCQCFDHCGWLSLCLWWYMSVL